jgi:condensin complex subunit 1
MLLGMIGKTNKDVLISNMDVLTKHGLGEAGDYRICKYACVALQQLYYVKRQKGVYAASIERKTPDHPTCERIISLLLQPTDSANWYSYAEQAINSVYLMIEQPDKVFAEVIKILASRAFGEEPSDAVEDVAEKLGESLQISVNEEEGEQMKVDNVEEPSGNENAEDEDMKVAEAETKKITSTNNHSNLLSQLVFVVGHVAIKQIVHLESIESEWKRRKSASDTKNESRPKTDELEMVTGTAEDEFADTIALVREKELLFGTNSLLSVFGPIIAHILTHNQKFKVIPCS